MSKIILFIIPFLVIAIVFLGIVMILNRDGGKGALQVTSMPSAQIYLGGKYIGKSPICLCELQQLLKVGEYDLKLIPVEDGYKTFETNITIHQGVLTVVDRTFNKQNSLSSGSVITLSPIDDKKKSEILVVSFPSSSQVVLDSNIEGVTPLLLKEITPSDHEIKILKDGYSEKIIKVKTVEGKRLEATINLGIKTDKTSDVPKASPSATIKPDQKLIILDTPNGFLRVRELASVDSNQIAVLNTGDKVDLISEKDEWYEIRMNDGKMGWISSAYASKEN